MTVSGKASPGPLPAVQRAISRLLFDHSRLLFDHKTAISGLTNAEGAPVSILRFETCTLQSETLQSYPL